MKIDLSSIDLTQFMVHPHIINGEICHLVQPQHIGAKWQRDTLIFRSSLWNNDGELISGSFPKFFNWSEQPDITPLPTTLKNTKIVEKIDGSTLIVSKYKSNHILRTRGTTDATKLDNGHEIEMFKQHTYIDIIDRLNNYSETWDKSYLFEWTSPCNKIVISYGDDPRWFLVGIVDHSDYSLLTQTALDHFASEYGFLRPPTYDFPSIEDLLRDVNAWKNREGICIYSNHGQTIHKIKAMSYLLLHRFKSEATLENTLDLYFTMGKPSYQEFEIKLIAAFDHECFSVVRGFASNICDAQKEVQKILDGFDTFINDTLKQLPSRKEQAIKVIAAYGSTNRAAFVFAKLDGKTLTDDQEKKLYWQVLKK